LAIGAGGIFTLAGARCSEVKKKKKKKKERERKKEKEEEKEIL
jgi:hypothetical protein